MVLVPPGAVGLKFWRPDAVDKRTRNAWNVEDKTANVTLSNNDKTATSSSFAQGVHSTTSHLNGTIGKFYAEFVFQTNFVQRQLGIQLVSRAESTADNDFSVLTQNGSISINGVTVGVNTLGGFGLNDVLSIAWDAGAERVWFRRNNGLWNNDASSDPATNTNGFDASFATATDYALWAYFTGSAAITLRTEIADFTYSVPSDFTSWMGDVLPEATGTSDLAADVAAVSGAGDVGSAEVTGTGAVAADAVAVSGAGVSASSGTGALVAQDATAAGAGVSASIGSGALAVQAATASGAGAVASIGTGALATQAATVAGAGLSVSVGAGALQAGAAAVIGAGASASIGTGSLVAGPAEVAGTGTAAAANSGALVAQAGAVAGLGVSASIGIGALQADAAAIAGAGLVASVGTGDLVAGSAAVAGAGEVIAAGAAVGTGALVAGAATLSGEGEVSGEVAPPVSAAIGGHWRPEPHRPPLVEGVGYAILPALEGEAHGVVLVAGAGAALPRISGVGTGAAGVAGHSAAQFTAIKAAAAGDRGQAGAARAVLKAAAASGSGVAGAYGTGAGTIQLKGSALGRHDDDEAAIMALLLAA